VFSLLSINFAGKVDWKNINFDIRRRKVNTPLGEFFAKKILFLFLEEQDFIYESQSLIS
jgi:hypothetical protein